MIKVAVAADLHLPDLRDTLKEKVWHWLLPELQKRQVDIFAGGGDLTAVGTVAAAARIMSDLQSCGIRFILTPGNSELRTPEQTGEVLQMMSTVEEMPPVAVLDSSTGRLSAAAAEYLRRLAGSSRRNLLVVTHYPPESWSAEDQAVLAGAVSCGVIGKLVHGHKHYDRCGGVVEAVRGLDPDKAIGGAPAAAVYTLDNGVWTREDIACPEADLPEWPLSDRAEFFRNIGICGMKMPVEYLEYAADKGIANFELRYREPETFVTPEFKRALQKWRDCGGKILSLHLPDIKLENNVFTGQEKMADAIRLALLCRCERVTVHVPRGYQDEFSDPAMLRQAASEFTGCLRPLLENNVQIGVENLHTTAMERAEKRYKFGCTAAECRNFVGALREAAGDDGKLIGFHLDIGHARNNAPFCHQSMLSEWYAGMGDLINGMHIHQVTQVDGEMKNHVGFTGLFTRLISLAGLGMAWKCGQIGRNIPMFLELRTPVPECWECLQCELHLEK